MTTANVLVGGYNPDEVFAKGQEKSRQEEQERLKAQSEDQRGQGRTQRPETRLPADRSGRRTQRRGVQRVRSSDQPDKKISVSGSGEYLVVSPVKFQGHWYRVDVHKQHLHGGKEDRAADWRAGAILTLSQAASPGFYIASAPFYARLLNIARRTPAVGPDGVLRQTLSDLLIDSTICTLSTVHYHREQWFGQGPNDWIREDAVEHLKGFPGREYERFARKGSFGGTSGYLHQIQYGRELCLALLGTDPVSFNGNIAWLVDQGPYLQRPPALVGMELYEHSNPVLLSVQDNRLVVNIKENIPAKGIGVRAYNLKTCRYEVV